MLVDFLLALAAVTLAWWLSTGVVLLLNHRSATTQRLSMLGMTTLLVAAVLLLPSNSRDLTAAGAITGFACGLCVWAWLEMSYLMGFITGPRSAPCPPQASGAQRFGLGIQTSLYHELLVVAAVLLTAWLTSGGANRVAAATCATLGIMRWSAKLNLFLGVRNYNQDWLPGHLAYLDSYTRRARFNPLFPISVAGGSAVAIALLLRALQTDSAFERAADLLISALLSLAVLEHWFLMLPFRESALWRWARPENGAGSRERKPSLAPRLQPVAAEEGS
jgi:putative photosynthetic complex assembly protein 2